MSIREKVIRHILLLVSAIILLFPLLYAFLVSLMETGHSIGGQIFPTSLNWVNYADVMKSVPLLKFIFNSFIFAILIMLGQLITSSLAAFALVFIEFRGKTIVFMLIMSTMMIPWEATIIPNFDTVIRLGWLNSFKGLVIPHLAMTLGIFLLRQHFFTIPKEIHEAAQLDGCSRFRFYWNIVLPLSKTMLAALGVFSFISAWNQYLWPLLVTNSNDIRTVQIGMKMLTSAEEVNSFPIIMAGIILIVLPTLLILIVGHRFLSQGLAAYSQR